MNDTTHDVSAAPFSRRTLVSSWLIAIGLFIIFFWPLPLHLSSAVVQNVQPPGQPTVVKPLDPGDAMQLMYHFWMFKDMLAGNTPWFHNLYEFNVGDDAARLEPSVYYFPFSLFFTVGFWMDGHSGGWNLASIISIWLTVWFTFIFVRRYTVDETIAWCCTVVGLALPYRWMTLGGGSPTGFSMAWIPLLLLGIDLMVHRRSIAGGVLAGLSILLSSFCDSHCFFFSVLATPAWFLFAWIYRLSVERKPFERPDLRATLAAGGCIALFVAGAFTLQRAMTAVIRTSTSSGGRSLREVELYTPEANGLFAWNVHGVSEHIYIGYALLLLVGVGLLGGLHTLLHASNRRYALRLLIPFALIVSGSVLVIFLALGINGPFKGQVFLWARELISPYQMIRQTAKAYCLLPSIIAVVAALAFQIARLAPVRAWMVVWGITAVFVVLEANTRVHPLIGVVPKQQQAYAAVAADAKANNRIPRAVAITLWPGESHYSAVYQHWGSLYHVRMVNGYFPFVTADYFDGVFRKLEMINIGLIDTAQREWLTSRGIDYVIVHENTYPQKVSPYPIGYALNRLLENPYLDLVAQDGPVWAFRIRNKPHPSPADKHDPLQWPCAREQEAEGLKESRGHSFQDATASGGMYTRLDVPGEIITVRPWDYGPGAEHYWSLRVRGNGTIRVHRFVMGNPAGTVDVDVASDEWSWVQVQIPTPETRREAHAEVVIMEGLVDVDQIQLLAGQPIELTPGQSWSMNAAHFFHAGYSSPAMEDVIFDPTLESPGTLLYGPRLPFPPGRYMLSVDSSATAPVGSKIGEWKVYLQSPEPIASAEMIAGTTLSLELDVSSNLPLNMTMTLNPFTHPVTIRSVTMKRID